MLPSLVQLGDEVRNHRVEDVDVQPRVLLELLEKGLRNLRSRTSRKRRSHTQMLADERLEWLKKKDRLAAKRFQEKHFGRSDLIEPE